VATTKGGRKKKAKKASKKKMGRPSKYDPEKYPGMARVACEDLGAKDIDLCHLFKIVKETLYKWQREYPEFMDSVKAGRDAYDSRDVENRLIDRALGYKYEEITHERIPVYGPAEEGKKKGPVIGFELVETKKVIKEVAPDITAMIFWLKNRQPARWRDVRQAEVRGQVDHSHEHEHEVRMKEIEQPSDERAAEILRILATSGALTASTEGFAVAQAEQVDPAGTD